MNQWLEGKKTLLASIAGFLTTAGTFILSLQDGFQIADLQILGVGIFASLGVLGVGGKLQKIVEALNEKK